MPKIALALTALALTLTLTACGGSEDPKKADFEKCVTAAKDSGHRASEYVPVCETATGYTPK